jgi:PAS domain S-box-containing protein
MKDPATLLIIDDEKSIRQSIRLFFEDLGYRVLEAENGSVGLALFREKQPDLVLVDLRMPVAEGLEVIESIVGDGSDIPVVVLLEREFIGEAMETLRRGAWDYVTKPLGDMIETELVVKKALERSRLRQGGKKYRTFVETTNEWIWSCDLEGRTTYCNPAVEKILGYAPEELMAKPIDDLLHPEDLKDAQTILGDAIREKKGWNGFVLRWQHKNGTFRYLESNAAPMIDGKGRLSGFLGADRDITERKKAEEALRFSEEKFSKAFQTSPDAVNINRLSDGVYLDINESFTRNTGYTREDVIGRSSLPGDLGIWVNQEDRDHLIASLKATGEAKGLEAPFRCKDGRVIYCRMSARIMGINGETCILSITSDITERKQAEEALLESEERYRELVENMNDVVYQVGPDGLVTYVGPVVEAIAGFKPLEVKGSNYRTFFLPEDQSRLEETFQMSLQGSHIEGEYRIPKKNGELMWVWVSSRPARRGDRIIGVQGILRDITEKRIAEQTLEKKAEELDILNSLGREMGAELSIEGTVGSGLAHIKQSLNPDLIMIFLSEGGELVLRGLSPMDKSFPGENVPIHRVGQCLCGLAARDRRAVYSRNIHTDPRCTFEECKRAGFSSLVALPLISGGQVIGVLGMGSFAERAFEERSAFLEALGGEIAIGLNNAILFEKAQGDALELQIRLNQIQEAEKEKETLTVQLQQAQKMEAIGTLAGGIAHDFNNILTPIIMGSEMAKMSVPEENPAYPILEKILEAGMRAKDLVQQILIFSRQSDLEKKPLKMVPILKETLKLARASLPSTIEIRQDIQAEQDTVLANPTQIHQVMMNLFANAAHAMRENGGLLEVTLREEFLDESFAAGLPDLTPGRYLRMSVKDTGHGMDRTIMDRIFNPFFSTKVRGEGTGLGLSIVHGIIKSYGGEILVESRPGEGTTFTLYIPVSKAMSKENEKKKKVLPRGSERILVVDDESEIVNVYSNMLQRLGYRVETRTDPVEALGTVKMDPLNFDLIITDMTMPRLTGDRLTQEIKKIRPDLPVILCTGFSEKLEVDNAIITMADAFLEKPMAINELALKIRQLLDAGGAGKKE